jgi:G patch domain/KOW motif-containing protein
MNSSEGGTKKIGFSLTSSKKGKKRGSSTTPKAAVDFGDAEEDQNGHDNESINNDIPKKPLIIPCKEDSRKSLQEQARARRKNNDQPDVVGSNGVSTSNVPKSEVEDDTGAPVERAEGGTNGTATAPAALQTTEEDRVAIQALEREAAVAQGKDDGRTGIDNGTNKRVIASTGDTFQRQSDGKDSEQKKFEAGVEELPPDISVKSQVYKSVPISEFGAAMLRGMGWNGGNDDNNSNGTNNRNKQASDQSTMPRPSRLGLGATPKMMSSGDFPDTHSRRRPRRHDQLQREERLKRQQEEMEKERHRQLSLDKQRVLQLGSIVFVDTYGDEPRRGRRRAIVKKLAGVPGLNMILVQYEGDATPTKVKKGSIQLVERMDLNDRPFQYSDDEQRRGNSDRKHRDHEKRDRDSKSTDDRDVEDRRRDRKRERSEQYKDIYDGDGSGQGRDRGRDDDRHKRKRDGEKHRKEDKKRHKSKRPSDTDPFSHSRSNSSSASSSWLTPNIRVRVKSSRYGDTVYKQKGVVVDVTRKGVATLKMGDGQVINVAERHLETALPKAGGSCIILSGDQRFFKGRLLERDSKKNRGVLQVYEDMSVVTTSLDDMAEWCGPLDDDLEH